MFVFVWWTEDIYVYTTRLYSTIFFFSFSIFSKYSHTQIEASLWRNCCKWNETSFSSYVPRCPMDIHSCVRRVNSLNSQLLLNLSIPSHMCRGINIWNGKKYGIIAERNAVNVRGDKNVLNDRCWSRTLAHHGACLYTVNWFSLSFCFSHFISLSVAYLPTPLLSYYILYIFIQSQLFFF